MGMLLLRLEGQRLKSFRLSEVPEVIRQKYGPRIAAHAHNRAVKRGYSGYALLEEVLPATQAYAKPSESVYRISQEAWDAMLAEAEVLERKAALKAVRQHVVIPAGTTEMIEVA